MTHRVVRFADTFFASLDEQLPGERSAGGGPSVSDFLVFDVPAIRDRLASGAEGCSVTMPPGHAVRAYIGSGALVRYFVVYLVIRPDDVVEVLDIIVDQ